MNKPLFGVMSLTASILLITYTLNLSASTIIGTIIYTSGRPADDVVVLLYDQYQYTDSRGKFRFRDIPPGPHTLEVKKNRRLIKAIEIDVNDPSETVDIQL
jgi:hypothetical protein